MTSKVARERKQGGGEKSRERLTEVCKHRNAYGWGAEKTNEKRRDK